VNGRVFEKEEWGRPFRPIKIEEQKEEEEDVVVQ